MSLRSLALLHVALLFANGCVSTAPPSAEPGVPLAIADGMVPGVTDGEPYAGLSLRDAEDGSGAVVSWVLPGPLKGTGFKSPFIKRNDVIVSVDGEPVDAEGFTEIVKAHRPGETLRLLVRHSLNEKVDSVPVPGEGGEIKPLDLVLSRKHEWTGPVWRDTPSGRPQPAVADQPTALEAYLGEQLEEHGLREEVQKLIDLFAETQTERAGYNTLSHVIHPFQQPMRFPEVANAVTEPLTVVPKDPRQALIHGSRLLDLGPPAVSERFDLSDPVQGLWAVIGAMDRAGALRRQAFAEVPPAVLATIPTAIRGYMESLDPYAGDIEVFIEAISASIDVDFAALTGAAGELAGLTIRSDVPLTEWPVIKTPRALRQAVKGDILAAKQTGGRWYVYGGFGDNEYDLTQLALVIDPGGNDTYRAGGEVPAVQAVVDMAGDDAYEGAIATGVLGVNLLVDYAGKDTYTGELNSVGACLMGVGLLVDHGGDDTYRAGAWSLGAGFYGLGAIVDLGGSDVYWGDFACQGIGGPRGVGLIVDRGGNDLYRANGPTGSAYGTAAVYYGLSQGVGFGVRGFDSGGIGVLQDSGGNDRYEAGEFSQGGGYYWALGILDDRHGSDFYYGNRYGQGFGCHQALGVLLDRSGDDVYWAMTAANQGAAWDIGMGMLIDFAGNDAYRADGLSQGGAAMQGIAWLIDWQGSDTYRGPNRSQGISSGNAYHYERTQCQSWSLLLDAGGTDDVYSQERPNGGVLTPGKLNEAKPEDSWLYGLFIDTAEKLELK